MSNWIKNKYFEKLKHNTVCFWLFSIFFGNILHELVSLDFNGISDVLMICLPPQDVYGGFKRCKIWIVKNYGVRGAEHLQGYYRYIEGKLELFGWNENEL